jgi:hypothetical protein
MTDLQPPPHPSRDPRLLALALTTHTHNTQKDKTGSAEEAQAV